MGISVPGGEDAYTSRAGCPSEPVGFSVTKRLSCPGLATGQSESEFRNSPHLRVRLAYRTGAASYIRRGLVLQRLRFGGQRCIAQQPARIESASAASVAQPLSVPQWNHGSHLRRRDARAVDADGLVAALRFIFVAAHFWRRY